jgi:hypothetical protein
VTSGSPVWPDGPGVDYRRRGHEQHLDLNLCLNRGSTGNDHERTNHQFTSATASVKGSPERLAVPYENGTTTPERLPSHSLIQTSLAIAAGAMPT